MDTKLVQVNTFEENILLSSLPTGYIHCQGLSLNFKYISTAARSRPLPLPASQRRGTGGERGAAGITKRSPVKVEQESRAAHGGS